MNIVFMSRLNAIIQDMSGITLSEMNHVKLMRRRDTKYVVPFEALSDILEEVKDDYFVLEIDGHRTHDYETLYFDTSDYKMYYAHHNKRLNRYKIRMRRYLLSGDQYLEVKFKNNKEETVKTRIAINDFSHDSDPEKAIFLKENSPFELDEIIPKLKNRFERITLVSKHRAERLTIDLDLRFINHDTKLKKEIGELVVVEVKRDLDGGKSDIVDVLHRHHFRSQGFSKYCIGTALIHFNVRMNLFKERVRSLGLL